MEIKLADGSVIEYIENVESVRGNRSKDVLWWNEKENEEKEEDNE